VSYEEKGVWTSLVVTVAVSVWYALAVAGQLRLTTVDDHDFRPTLLWAIGISIGASIVVRILVEILTPSDSYKVDARDKAISRRGGYLMGMVVSIGMIGPLALAILSADAFWIANSMFAVYVVGSIAGGVAQLIAYRRGF
jgi:hypothetical protein